MKKLNSIIIDTSEKQIQILKNVLSEYCPEVEVCCSSSDLKESYQLFLNQQPQLIFLNPDFEEGNGFNFLKEIRGTFDYELIIISNKKDYAIKAFQYNPVSYLLQPYCPKELIQAIYRVKINLEEKAEYNREQILLNNYMQTFSNRADRIGIPTIDGLELVEVSEIIRCEGLQRCTRIILENRKSIVSSYNLGAFKDLLSKHGFFSCHRSHIINLQRVKQFKNEGTIIMDDNSYVPVARRKKQEFLQMLTRLVA